MQYLILNVSCRMNFLVYVFYSWKENIGIVLRYLLLGFSIKAWHMEFFFLKKKIVNNVMLICWKYLNIKLSLTWPNSYLFCSLCTFLLSLNLLSKLFLTINENLVSRKILRHGTLIHVLNIHKFCAFMQSFIPSVVV